MKKWILISIIFLLVLVVGAYIVTKSRSVGPAGELQKIESLVLTKTFSGASADEAIGKFESYYDAQIVRASQLKSTDRVGAVRTASDLEATLRVHELVLIRLKLLGGQGVFFDNFMNGLRGKIESATKLRVDMENELGAMPQEDLAKLAALGGSAIQEEMVASEKVVVKLREKRGAKAVSAAQGLLEQAAGKITDGQTRLSGGENLQAFLAFEEARRFLLQATILIEVQENLALNLD